VEPTTFDVEPVEPPLKGRPAWPFSKLIKGFHNHPHRRETPPASRRDEGSRNLATIRRVALRFRSACSAYYQKIDSAEGMIPHDLVELLRCIRDRP
jgi:hypothetical protein